MEILHALWTITSTCHGSLVHRIQARIRIGEHYALETTTLHSCIGRLGSHACNTAKQLLIVRFMHCINRMDLVTFKLWSDDARKVFLSLRGKPVSGSSEVCARRYNTVVELCEVTFLGQLVNVHKNSFPASLLHTICSRSSVKNSCHETWPCE